MNQNNLYINNQPLEDESDNNLSGNEILIEEISMKNHLLIKKKIEKEWNLEEQKNYENPIKENFSIDINIQNENKNDNQKNKQKSNSNLSSISNNKEKLEKNHLTATKNSDGLLDDFNTNLKDSNTENKNLIKTSKDNNVTNESKMCIDGDNVGSSSIPNSYNDKNGNENKDSNLMEIDENEKSQSSYSIIDNFNSGININKNEFYIKRLDLNDFIKSSQNMISDYICELCKGIYWDPHVDGCGHVFCKDCFYKFIEILKRNVCPITKKEIDLNLVSPIKFVAGILEKQILKCQHKECQWTGKLIDYLPHLNAECSFEQVKCIYSQCKVKLQRINIQKHEENCDFCPSECQKCSEKMLLGQIEIHKNICSKEKISCVQSCGSFIERNLMDTHIENNCKNSLINCHYLEFGCNEKIKKCDLKSHLIDEVNFHNLQVCKFLKQFKTNLINRVENIENILCENNEKFDDIYSFLETDLKRINEMVLLGKKGLISNKNLLNKKQKKRNDKEDELIRENSLKDSKNNENKKYEENKNDEGINTYPLLINLIFINFKSIFF